MKKLFTKPNFYLGAALIIILLFCIGLLLEISHNKSEIQNIQDQYADLQSQIPVFYTIVSEWRPFVAHVACSFGGNTANVGSGFLSENHQSGQVIVATSKHIVMDDAGNPARSCQFILPGSSTVYAVTNIQASSDVDFASLIVGNPSVQLTQLAAQAGNHSACDKTETATGNWIVVLGYPVNGSPDDITATTGIISGYDGDYYVTNAKIDHGSSGGVAILRKQDCYLGIPSYVEPGGISSFARILDFNAIYTSK